MRARLDLGVHVSEELLEDDVDLGASFVPLARDFAQVFSAVLTECDLGDLNGLHGAGVAGTHLIVRLALAVGARATERGLVLRRLRGGLARVLAVFGGVLFHEHRHQQLKQHQQRLNKGAAFRRHLPAGAQLLEATLERLELLPQGLLVDAAHEATPRSYARS